MISSLTGILTIKTPTLLEIVVGGVGFKVSIPLSTFKALPETENSVSLFTYLYVKENILELIGFAKILERDVFELLIAVSGIGAKLALTILSGIEPETLVESILTEDKALLATVSGVGPKTAGRMVLELKGKIGKLASVSMVIEKGSVGHFEEAILALQALGYSRYEARKAVDISMKEIDKDATTEHLIKEALRVGR